MSGHSKGRKVTDADQRREEALEDEDGRGGPFTKAQQQEKIDEQGDRGMSGRS